MIAFLAKDMRSGLSIIQADFPTARIARASGFVYFDPREGAPPSGIIASDGRALQGRDLSGFVLLTDDVPKRLQEEALIRTRKPFYWHVRTNEERGDHVAQQGVE